MPARFVGAVDRREFIGTCACVLAGASLFGCASLVTRPVTPVDGRIVLPIRNYPELSEPGGALKILPDGQTDPVYVLVEEAQRFTALSPICTHLGCTVEIQGPRLVCPCHGSTYDRAGSVVHGPATLPLARFATSLSSDGLLTIDLRRRG